MAVSILYPHTCMKISPGDVRKNPKNHQKSMFFDPPRPREAYPGLPKTRGYLHADPQLLGRPGDRVMSHFVLFFFELFLRICFFCFSLVLKCFSSFSSLLGGFAPQTPQSISSFWDFSVKNLVQHRFFIIFRDFWLFFRYLDL